MSTKKRRYPHTRLGRHTRGGAWENPYPIRGRAYYVVDIRSHSHRVVAGPFSPVGKADKYLARHFSTKTHQVIDGRYLSKHDFGDRKKRRTKRPKNARKTRWGSNYRNPNNGRFC